MNKAIAQILDLMHEAANNAPPSVIEAMIELADEIETHYGDDKTAYTPSTAWEGGVAILDLCRNFKDAYL